MRNPGQDADQQKHKTRRHEREDLVQRYRDIEREVNALRPSFKGKPMPDIISMLEHRFGADLDTRTLDRCAQAFEAGEAIQITPPSPPPQRAADRPRRSPRERD